MHLTQDILLALAGLVAMRGQIPHLFKEYSRFLLHFIRDNLLLPEVH